MSPTSKRRYRASELHQVNWEQIRELSGDGRVIFPIGVAKEDFVPGLMRPDRTVLVAVKWRHPQPTRALIERVVGLGGRRIEAVMEPSGTYGDALAGLLRAAGVAIYRVSPKRVYDAAELYDGVPSLHDAMAGYALSPIGSCASTRARSIKHGARHRRRVPQRVSGALHGSRAWTRPQP